MVEINRGKQFSSLHSPALPASPSAPLDDVQVVALAWEKGWVLKQADPKTQHPEPPLKASLKPSLRNALSGSFARHILIANLSIKVYRLSVDEQTTAFFFPPNKVSLEMDPLLNPESAWHIPGDIWHQFFIIRLH